MSLILIVDDSPEFLRMVSRHLQRLGHQVECAPSGEGGLELFRSRTPDLVLLDLVLPGLDGLQVLQKMKELEESVAVIVMTADASIAAAVEAMRLGALDFVAKPLDLDALGARIGRAQEVIGLKADLGYLLERERRHSGLHRCVGSSPAMLLVYQRIQDVAQTGNTTVLITGPSGTGKEITARAIHSLSARSRRPLIQIDCTAIPLTLLESELFGHERGAFTGADRTKKGLLELADGGTMLLDEIGDMELGLQAKFLRVLQERQFRRVGGTRDIPFDVRVIAATNQDLDRLAEEGQFRRDLLYRLKVFQIELPPLCERGNDVVELAQRFLAENARTLAKPLTGFDEEACAALLGYSFPGNVRELRNIVEQASILARSPLITRDLLSLPVERRPVRPPPPAPAGEPGGGGARPGALPLSLDALGADPLVSAERELIRQALERTGNNKKRAAALLGISRFALQRKLDRLALESLGMGGSK